MCACVWSAHLRAHPVESCPTLPARSTPGQLHPPCRQPHTPHIRLHVHTAAHTAQLIDGNDTLDKMEKVPVDGADRPKQELRINRVTIHANPLAG